MEPYEIRNLIDFNPFWKASAMVDEWFPYGSKLRLSGVIVQRVYIQ